MGTHQDTIQSPKRLYKAAERLYKAPTDYKKPQQTIQSRDRLYKAPTNNTTPKKIIQTFKNRENPTIFDKDLKYITRVLISINSPYNIKYLISKTTYINSNNTTFNKGYELGPYTAIILPCLILAIVPSWATPVQQVNPQVWIPLKHLPNIILQGTH